MSLHNVLKCAAQIDPHNGLFMFSTATATFNDFAKMIFLFLKDTISVQVKRHLSTATWSLQLLGHQDLRCALFSLSSRSELGVGKVG